MAIFHLNYLNQVQIAANTSSRNRAKSIIQRFPSYVMGASDGYKMLLLHGHFENKSTTKIPQYALLLSCKINDTYEYDDSSITFGFESGNSGEISPQDDLDYFIRIDLPEKAADGNCF